MLIEHLLDPSYRDGTREHDRPNMRTDTSKMLERFNSPNLSRRYADQRYRLARQPSAVQI